MLEWGVRGKASVLVGGQFGSEGKGLAAAWLAEESGTVVDIATTNAGAQAGHTTKYRSGHSFVCYHLPTTAVVQKDYCVAYINGGSIIDIEALHAEIEACGVRRSNVIIHPRAAIITDSNRATERDNQSSTAKIASTQKGVGAAIADKVMRRGRVAEGWLELHSMVHALDLNTALHGGRQSVVVEVPQGTDLSLNHGLAYPYTTSRDCWVGSGISDAGIHPSFVGPVCMVVRTFPIRVGHLKNELGESLGPSGPFYAGSRELDWAANFPGIEPERTTVTKRVRRIATWSNNQYEHGLSLNRPTIVFLNFCNYLHSRDELSDLLHDMRVIERKLGVDPKHVFGFGPCVEDVTDNFNDAVAWYDHRRF